MLKRLFSAAALTISLCAVPLPAAATDYTDIWFLAAESGWGVNLIQAQDIIFITFFIYDSSGQPTWVVSTMQEDGNGNFSGNLYSTVGSFYGAPWNTSAFVPTLVGSASFFPTSAYTGTLTYVVSGVTVTKTIQRQTLKTIGLGGNYAGGQAGKYAGSSCSLGSYEDKFDVTVTQPGDGTVSFAFSYTSGLSCTLSGTLMQQGQLYSVPGAAYVCSDGTNTTARMDEVKATAQGVEGTFFAPSVGSGCSESAAFSGVLL